MDDDFTNALRLLEEKEVKSCRSTGCFELDYLIGNGIELGTFYLFYGDDESCIDQFLHQTNGEHP